MGLRSILLTLLSNLNKAIDQSLKSVHLFPEGVLFLQCRFCLLFPLPGEDVPPWMSLLIVDEEKSASDDMAEKGWDDANKEELRMWCEVGVLQEPEASFLKRVDQGGGHGPGDQDVDASHAH